MNLEKVIFGFFIIFACTLNFGFFIGDIERPELHHPMELLAAVVVIGLAAMLDEIIAAVAVEILRTKGFPKPVGGKLDPALRHIDFVGYEKAAAASEIVQLTALAGQSAPDRRRQSRSSRIPHCL